MSFTENSVAWCVFYSIGFMEGSCLWLYLERFWWVLYWCNQDADGLEIIFLMWRSRGSWAGDANSFGVTELGGRKKEQGCEPRAFQAAFKVPSHSAALRGNVAFGHLSFPPWIQRSSQRGVHLFLLLSWVKMTAGRSYFLPKLCHGAVSGSGLLASSLCPSAAGSCT